MIRLLFPLLLAFSAFACKGQGYAMEGNEIRTDHALQFRSGTSNLTPEDIKALAILRDFLNEKAYVSLLRIEAHVYGSARDQELSEQRALAVAQWLVKEGIDCKRLVPVGLGHTKPAEQKTRIQFVIAALKGHLIGGLPADGGGQLAADPCTIAKTAR